MRVITLSLDLLCSAHYKKKAFDRQEFLEDLMRLLTFAHQKEASAFLKQGNYHFLELAYAKAYQANDLYVLITGEGLFSTLQTLSAFLASHPQIKEVVNLGVCGALNPAIKNEEIFSIRTVYYQEDYHSFSSSDSLGKDLITSSQRVLDPQTRNHLCHFAPLVDRELWAQANACKLFKLPWWSFKIVSDQAGNEEQEICQKVKELAPLWSQKLLEYYQKWSETHVSSFIQETQAFSLFSDTDFHFTQSQKRKFLALIKGLGLQESDLPLEKYREKDILPKERAQALLEALNDQLNPFRKKVKLKLQELTLPLTESGLEVQFHPDYESDVLSLKAQISHPRHKEQLIKGLTHFDYEKVKSCLRGDLDV